MLFVSHTDTKKRLRNTTAQPHAVCHLPFNAIIKMIHVTAADIMSYDPTGAAYTAYGLCGSSHSRHCSCNI